VILIPPTIVIALQKLEEAQHYYDEKLAEKDDVIAALQEKVYFIVLLNK